VIALVFAIAALNPFIDLPTHDAAYSYKYSGDQNNEKPFGISARSGRLRATPTDQSAHPLP
jgi:hypothetical protein